jgi:hypothetical protein
MKMERLKCRHTDLIAIEEGGQVRKTECTTERDCLCCVTRPEKTVRVSADASEHCINRLEINRSQKRRASGHAMSIMRLS